MFLYMPAVHMLVCVTSVFQMAHMEPMVEEVESGCCLQFFIVSSTVYSLLQCLSVCLSV